MGVTRYTIQIGDEEIEFEGPDNLSEKQIEDLATKQLKTAKPGQTFSHPIYGGTYEAPAIPEDESSGFGSFMRGIPHGVFSNWDDELTAAGNAAIPGLAELDNSTVNPGQ